MRKNSAGGYGSLWPTVVGDDGTEKHVLVGRETVQNRCALCTRILAKEAARQHGAVHAQAENAQREDIANPNVTLRHVYEATRPGAAVPDDEGE